MVYLLAFYPGVMSVDSIKQWTQIVRFSFGDWHPVFHTFMEYLITRVWLSPAAIAIFQAGLFSFAFAAAMHQFDKMGMNRKLLLIMTAVFTFNPVNGILSITIMKDTPFTASVVFLTVLLVKIFHTEGKWIRPVQNKVLLVVTLVCTAMFRHNGLAPMLATVFILLVVYRKYWKGVLSVAIATGIIIFAIQGPFYQFLKVKPSSDYQPLVLSVIQISAIAHFNGNVSPAEKTFLSKLTSWEDWSNGYNKYSSLGVTKSKSYDWQKFHDNKTEYIKTWVSLVFKNPGIATQAYLARTNMIWQIISPSDLNISVGMQVQKNKYGIKMKPILPQVKFLLSKTASLTAKNELNWLFWRPAIYMYFIFLMSLLIIKRKKLKALTVFVPVLGNTLGLALVTTSSQPRYFYSTVLVAPIALLLYLHIKRTNKMKNAFETAPDLTATKKISILAATFSGNKGAASMLESIIDNVSAKVSDVGFDVLSVYPNEDMEQNSYENVRVVSCKAGQIVFGAFPLSILYLMFKWLPPIKKIILKNQILNSFSKCDLVVDAAGISFVDSRSFVMNFYNYICMFVPLALNKKVIKFSQAMGPFKKLPNRTLAKLVLPKIDTICARGLITESYLKELNLNNTVLCADGAFVLPDDKKTEKEIKKVISKSKFLNEKTVGLSISSVVYKYCIGAKIDYVEIMAEFIDYLTSNKGYNVLIIAQSARFGKESLKNNDLVICKKVFDSVTNKEKCMNLDSELTPREIREYIGSCEMLIASRFHAMISSLYKGVPVFLIGWTHKYKEVLDMFGLGNYAADYKQLSIDLLKENFALFEKDLGKIRKKITDNLDTVKASSMKNIEIIVAALDSREKLPGDNNE
jgi:polysaccharide pyruvyl transferase WcaK-like protein